MAPEATDTDSAARLGTGSELATGDRVLEEASARAARGSGQSTVGALDAASVAQPAMAMTNAVIVATAGTKQYVV